MIRTDPRLNQCFWKYKLQAYHFYHSTTVMYAVAGIILSNFVIECISRQIDPHLTEYPNVWRGFEVFFGTVFLLELLINMYGSWFRPFFSIGWNYFDIVVVLIGILTVAEVNLPGALEQILMLRAFRVFRLFGRIASLRKIILSIRKAIPGVMNAFIIMALVVCIYAVLAVDLFQLAYEGKNATEVAGTQTARGNVYGEEYYGTFCRALYSLFQLLTGESWSEAGVRPLLWEPEQGPGTVIICVIFFISFMIINSIVLLNVVVAVLLDGMNSAGDEVSSEKTPDPAPGDSTAAGESATVSEQENVEDDPNSEQAACQELFQVKATIGEMSTDLDDLLGALRRVK
jgi:hypothetical protein